MTGYVCNEMQSLYDTVAHVMLLLSASFFQRDEYIHKIDGPYVREILTLRCQFCQSGRCRDMQIHLWHIPALRKRV